MQDLFSTRVDSPDAKPRVRLMHDTAHTFGLNLEIRMTKEASDENSNLVFRHRQTNEAVSVMTQRPVVET